MCDQWDDDHGQKSATPNWSIDDAKEFLTHQAKQMPTDVTVKAKVIDARLR